MLLLQQAIDFANEAKGCIELGQKKRAKKAALSARRALEELSRSLTPRAPRGPDPRQEWLPNVHKY
jgi:hypothetical protein